MSSWMLSRLFTWGKHVEDPICGKSVPEEEASTYQFVGETYYFCSERCRDRFQALPARYVEFTVKLTDSSGSGGACC